MKLEIERKFLLKSLPEIKPDQIVEIVEVQVGDYLGEDDIVRYHDDWNRK